MSEYRFEHFHTTLLLEDRKFTSGPEVAESFPDFELATLDGGTFRSVEHLARRPLFLYTASVT